jgi:ferredoxin-NADP reductase
MAAKQFSLVFLKKQQIAENIYSFYFEKGEFDFLPGQYVRMILPHEHADDRGTSRFFTISSSPLEKDVVVTTKLLQSTFKNALMHLQEGTPVTMFGSLGNLVLHDDETRPMVFLSGGMGITPFRSVLRYAADKNLEMPLTLISSFSKGDEMLFSEELSIISREHKNIQVTFLDKRISEEILQENVADLQKPTYYLVGPPAMVEGVMKLLESLNISEEKIMTESFTGY